MIKQTFTIIKKNLRLLIRSRSSALIVILGPLLLMLFVGFAFNNVGTQDVEIGIYSDEYTKFTLAYVKTLADGPFRTLRYVSEDSCIDHIKRGLLSACVIFPPGMTQEDTQIDEIVFHVDYSRVNLVYQILGRIQREVGSTTEEISVDLTQGLLSTLTTLQEDMNETQKIIALTKEKQDESMGHLNTATNNLDDFSVAFKADNIDLDGANIGLGEARHEVTKIYNSHDIILGKCDDGMESGLKEALSCADSDEEEDSLRRKINKTPIYVENFKLEEAYGNIQREFNNSRDLLANLEGELQILDRDLVKIDDLKDEVTDTLALSKGQMLSAQEANDDTKENLETMYRNIDSLQVRNANNIVTPVRTDIRPVIPETTNLSYLFPALLSMVLMFGAILLASTLVITEKKSKAYFRNFISPLSSLASIIGAFLTTLFIVMLQMTILLTITDAYFNMNIIDNIFSVIIILFLIGSTFTLVGLLTGFIFNSEDTVILGAISISSLFLFVSDVILPLESMPAYIAKLAQYNPFVLGSGSLRKALLFAAPPETLTTYFWIFSAYCLGLFLFLLITEKLLKKHSIYKLTNQYAIKKQKKKWRQMIQIEEE